MNRNAKREHHEQLGANLSGAVIGNRELPDGIAITLSHTFMLVDLAEWVDAERRCCPFFDFRISLEREGGALELAMTGRPGVKKMALKEFAGLGSVR